MARIIDCYGNPSYEGAPIIEKKAYLIDSVSASLTYICFKEGKGPIHRISTNGTLTEICGLMASGTNVKL